MTRDLKRDAARTACLFLALIPAGAGIAAGHYLTAAVFALAAITAFTLTWRCDDAQTARNAAYREARANPEVEDEVDVEPIEAVVVDG